MFFRISLTGVCRMNLRKYPMDTQRCVLNIMSCKLMLYWKHKTRIDLYAIMTSNYVRKKIIKIYTYLQELTAEW